MSARIFDLKYKDIVVGRFVESNGTVEYSPVTVGLVNKLKNFQRYPLGLYPINIVLGNPSNYIPSETNILNWLQERVFPKERPNSLDILNSLGLREYDIWEIAKKTKALNDNDHYWITDDPNEKFSEVHTQSSVKTDLISPGIMLMPTGEKLKIKRVRTKDVDKKLGKRTILQELTEDLKKSKSFGKYSKLRDR